MHRIDLLYRWRHVAAGGCPVNQFFVPGECVDGANDDQRPVWPAAALLRSELILHCLHHARWINTDESVAKAMGGIKHDQPIVVYCSVGYRSSAYCAQLMNDGFTDVHDLKGSIFQWANAGLPVYRDGTIAHHVHPYNRHWGQLLERSLWAFHPPKP